MSPLPLETSADGVIRMLGTRVTLDPVWAAFNEAAEEIVQQYRFPWRMPSEITIGRWVSFRASTFS
jgi:hypothetical protein